MEGLTGVGDGAAGSACVEISTDARIATGMQRSLSSMRGRLGADSGCRQSQVQKHGRLAGLQALPRPRDGACPRGQAGGGPFDVNELKTSEEMKWRPHGDSNPGYCRERAVS